jgi:TonB family protein
MTISTATSFPVAAVSPPALTDDQAAKLLIYSPMPKYPSFAQRELLRAKRGYYTTTLFPRDPKGIFILRVHIKTGRVKEVVIERSTGEPILDVEAVRAFKQWRFKPGALPHLEKDASTKVVCLVRVTVRFRL